MNQTSTGTSPGPGDPEHSLRRLEGTGARTLPRRREVGTVAASRVRPRNRAHAAAIEADGPAGGGPARADAADAGVDLSDAPSL